MSWPSEVKVHQMFEFAPEDKRRFAAALIKTPADPLAAARVVFGTGAWALGKSTFVATFWINDPEVLLAQQELLQEETIEDLPSKSEAARRVWGWTEQGGAVSREKLEAMRLYSEMRGFIDKAGANVGVTVSVPPLIKFVLDDDEPAEQSTSPDTEAVAATA